MQDVFRYTAEGGFQYAGFVNDDGLVYGLINGERVHVGTVSPDGAVYARVGENLRLWCVVDERGAIYSGTTRAEPFAVAWMQTFSGTMLHGQEVFRDRRRQDDATRIGAVMPGPSTLFSAGAAALLLREAQSASGPRPAEAAMKPGGAIPRSTEDASQRDARHGLGTLLDNVAFWLVGGVGAALLYGYLGGLVFDHENTMRATLNAVVLITYIITAALAILMVASFVQSFLKRGKGLSAKQFALALLAGVGMGGAWTVLASVLPSLLSLARGDSGVNEFGLLCGGFAIGFFGMMSRYLDDNRQQQKRQ